MKQNKYDDPVFFEKYLLMERSKGLEFAGEWPEFRKMMPDLRDKRVLDLGCGLGWHCRYAAENGAKCVTGIDISQKMIAAARAKTPSKKIKYLCMPLEDIDFAGDSFDIVISSLALHYIESFSFICALVERLLVSGGYFVFSVEHPVFTAHGSQKWYCGDDGSILHWPVDGYFNEGLRTTGFLGEEVLKYHRTLTSYLNGLITAGFRIMSVVEPMPPDDLLHIDGMADELRRPIMLLVSSVKNE